MKNINFRVPFPMSRKEELDKICNNMGISSSALINIFIKSVILNNDVLFDVAKALRSSPLQPWDSGEEKIIRINDGDKDDFVKTVEGLGYDKRSVIHAFLVTVLNERRIPFEIRGD